MATWARGIDFKNSGNTARVGSVGVYGTDTSAEKIYIGLGTEPWNNAGLQITSSSVNFKGNKIYHAGDKPTLADIGAAASSHNHTSLSSVTTIGGAGSSGSWGSLDITGSKGSWQGIHFKDYGYIWMVRNDGYTGMWKNGGNPVFAFDQNGSLATGTVPWGKLTGVPSSFTPASHTHSYITGINDTRSTEYTPATARRDFKVTFQSNGTNGVNDGGTYYSLMHIPRWSDSAGGYGSQLIFTDNENIWYRRGTSDSAWGNWRRVWHSGNFDPNSKANSSHTHNYLPLTGGTVTGAINISGHNGLTANNKRFLWHHDNQNVTISAGGSSGDIYLGYNASTDYQTRYVRLESPMNWKGGNTIIDSNGYVPWNSLSGKPGLYEERGEINASTQWNDIVQPGGYKVQMAAWGATSLNGPNLAYSSLYSYGMLFVIKSNVSSENRITQIYFPHKTDNSNPIVTRMLNGGGWNSWSKIGRGLTYSDVGAAASSHNHDGVYMKQANANGYYGMTANGDASNWVRTTNSGIIPYASGGASSLGTSSWPFTNIYANNIYDNGVLLENKFAAASHSHSYLPLSGGTMTGAMSSSLTTSTHLAGNKGTAIINSTAAGTGYNMLAKMNSTNGVWTFGSYGTNFNFYYTANSTITAGTNNVTKALTLLNESGNSVFPGTVSAPTFSGALSGNASTATALQTARTFTIGNTGKNFNGTGNVAWTLAEIGAAASNHNHTYNVNDGWLRENGDNAHFKIYGNSRQVAFRTDGTTEYASGVGGYPFAFMYGGDAAANRLALISSDGDIWCKKANNWLTSLLAGKANSSHTHSYLPLSGGTVTSSDFAIKTTTTSDSSKYITFYDTSGVRRALMSTDAGSGGFKIHTYNSSGTWISNFVIEEDGSVHIGNGYLKAIEEIWGRSSSVNINIKKGTGYQGGARFNWTGSATIGGPRFQMVPMDNYDLRVGSPEMPIHVVYGRVGYVTTSDKNAKTNICYIDDLDKTKEYRTADFSTESLTKEDFYNFFKDEIKFASYDFKEANLDNLETNLGFMAQDIANTKVGSKIIIPPREVVEYHNEDGTIDEEKVQNGMYSYSTTNFAASMAIALQKAIEKIEALEEEIKLLKQYRLL